MSGRARMVFERYFGPLFAAATLLIGLGHLGPGLILARLGGSWFYVFSGALLLTGGLLILRGRRLGLHLIWLNFFATWVWALTEVGLDGWALLPRVDLVCGLTLFALLPAVGARLSSGRLDAGNWTGRGYPAAGAALVAVVVATISVLSARAQAGVAVDAAPSSAAVDVGAGDWPHFGQDQKAARHSSLTTINRDNAGALRQVWEHVEPAPPASSRGRKDEATPLQVGDKLFVCMTNNTVLALDAETGKVRWRHDPKTDLTGVPVEICRGLAYVESPASKVCPKRVLTATLDARMIALNADSGRPCEDFGTGGQISLKEGLGSFKPGMYYVTSPPTIIRGLAVVGALVRDNAAVDEPSGVIRAFDATTGKLAWAWDLGRTGDETGPPAAGMTYTPGTPNAWSIFSADEALGLVYLPMGNATPDFVGSHRSPASEKYSSSVVALEAATGRVRWSYQLVRHDLWDYDVSAQPVLFDMPMPGGPVPALVQATKQGDLFVLDRRTGAPLTPVAEQAVPQTDVPGEWTAKTQPRSIGMPNVGGPDLREVDMWGISPLDQLWCRIRFHQMRYDGDFTPPSTTGSLIYPGAAGGVDWGSVSVDPVRQLLIVPSFRLASTVRLVPRAEGEAGAAFTDLQSGTPYLLHNGLFITKLGVPCQRPPYGLLTAIDLRTRKVVWSKPLGTAEELGPRGVASHLPFTIGAAPIVGGPITTAGGLVFIGATGDWRLRAIDSQSGRELWSDKLPQGNQATPITYRAPRSGRQMVVFVSGAYASLRSGSSPSTHVVAYALP